MIDKESIKYNATFEKKGSMVYISHLDLMTLFRRAIRRAGLEFVLTRGFTPRVKISMPKALKVGKESNSEEMSFWLTEDKDPEELAEAINEQLPEGVRILEVVNGER
jgi:radical SAM-linked protein